MQLLYRIGETVRDSQKVWEAVRDMYKLYGTGHTVRDSQQPWETVRDSQPQ